MWFKRKKKRDEGLSQAPGEDEVIKEVDVKGAMSTDGTIFARLEGYGLMMIPPRALDAAFFGPRRRRRAKSTSDTGEDTREIGEASSDRQTRLLKEQQRESSRKRQDPSREHPVCSGDPTRIKDLLEEAQRTREAEQALREEAARLVSLQEGLELDVRQLQREKEMMTEAHRAQLERLRRELEEDAAGSRRRLEAELKEGHAESMDSLRKTLRSETERLAGETKRLREDLARARQASKKYLKHPELPATTAEADKNKRFSSSDPAGASQTKANAGTDTTAVDWEGFYRFVPASGGFLKLFPNVFRSKNDFVKDALNGMGEGATTVPPMVLPLFLFLLFTMFVVPLWRVLKIPCRRRRMPAHGRLVQGTQSSDNEAIDFRGQSELESALFETRSKLTSLENASTRAAAELDEANSRVQRLQAEKVKQEALLRSKVSDLASAESIISRLQETVSQYLVEQRELEEKVQGLRDEIGRLDATRKELEAKATDTTAERAFDMDRLRTQAFADVSSRLEELEKERTTLQQELQEKVEALKVMSAQKKEADASYSQLRTETSELRVRAQRTERDMNIKLQAAYDKLASAKNEFSAAKAAEAAAVARADGLQGSVQRLEGALSDSVKENAGLKTSARETAARGMADNYELVARVEVAAAGARDAEDRAAGFRARIQELSAASPAGTQEAAAALTQNAAEMASLLKEVEDLRAAAAGARTKELQAEVACLGTREERVLVEAKSGKERLKVSTEEALTNIESMRLKDLETRHDSQAVGLQRAYALRDSTLQRSSALEGQLEEAKLQLEAVRTERSELAAKVSKLDARLRAKGLQEGNTAERGSQCSLSRQVRTGRGEGEGESSPENTRASNSTRRQSREAQIDARESSNIDPGRVSLERRVHELKLELDAKNVMHAKAEEKVMILEAQQEDVACMIKDIRQEKEKYVTELKRKREKVATELTKTRAAQRAAEKRCRQLEADNEAMMEDYEGRLQQQVANYETEFTQARDGQPSEEAEVERLKRHIDDIEDKRKLTAQRLRELMDKLSQNEMRFLAAVDTEKERADHLEVLLEGSREDRDAECERLQRNIDSLKEQLDVKSATVKHLWEKVAAIRRSKSMGDEELKAKLDDAEEAKENLSRLAEEQQEQLDRLRRRAKRMEEDITKTVMARLQAQGVRERSAVDSDAAEGPIEAERVALRRKCQRQEQQVVDLRKLIDEIAKLEHGAPEVPGETDWETLSVSSDVSGMSQDSSLVPKAVDDIPETKLRELAGWFRARAVERRRLLKRYRAGRLKTKALAARKQAGGDMFASVRGTKLPLKSATYRPPTSDTSSVKSMRSTRSNGTVARNPSHLKGRERTEESSGGGGGGLDINCRKVSKPRDGNASPRPSGASPGWV